VHPYPMGCTSGGLHLMRAQGYALHPTSASHQMMNAQGLRRAPSLCSAAVAAELPVCDTVASVRSAGTVIRQHALPASSQQALPSSEHPTGQQRLCYSSKHLQGLTLLMQGQGMRGPGYSRTSELASDIADKVLPVQVDVRWLRASRLHNVMPTIEQRRGRCAPAQEAWHLLNGWHIG
jgi:hypothetical protein